jgi:hypothetical protein
MLAALQRLPRDAELLAMEASGEDYSEREVDEVELEGGGCTCISGSGELPRHAAKAVDGPTSRSSPSIERSYGAPRSGRPSTPRGPAPCERAYLRLTD